MRQNEILELEKNIILLEKKAESLEEFYKNKDLQKFEEIKRDMIYIQKKIRSILS